jgi:hypothetical protein
LFSDEAAYGGLTRAHESDERDVFDVAGVGHGKEVTDLLGRCTIISVVSAICLK